MESIREIFKDKGFSNKELSYLENAINEFQEVFGNHVSREDLIELVKGNVNIIEFTEQLDSKTTCAIGCYCLQDRKIQVKSDLSDEEAKSVFFHEFLHAIVGDGENTGFYRIYDISDYDGIRVEQGRGFNEGFVQMLTQERDRKVAKKVISTGYPVLTAAVEKFSDLYGKSELIELYFKNPDKFMDYMFEKSNSFSEDFLHDFDVIHKYEKEIMKKRSLAKSFISLLLGRQIDQEVYDIKLINAQEEIIQVYLDEILKEKIESPTALQDTLKKINDIYSIFSKTVSSYTLQRLIERTNPDVLNDLDTLDHNSKALIESQLLFIKFRELSTTEKLMILSDPHNEFINGIGIDLSNDYESLRREYFSLMASELYENSKEFQNKDMFSWMDSFSGVAKYILENDLSFENLKILYNRYQDYGNVFELYNLQEDGRYEKVTTLVVDDYLNTIEYKEIGSEEWAELNKRFQRENCGNLIEAVGDQKSNFVAYDEDGQVFVSTEYDEIVKPTDTISIESVNELKLKTIEQQIQDRTTRLKMLQNLQAPDFIIQHESARLEEVMKEKSRVLESIKSAARKEITPSQIEAITINGDVTVQTMQSTLAELSTQDKVMENEGEDLNVE